MTYQTSLTVPSVPGDIDTAYWHAEQPFDGKPDNPADSAAATVVWAQPCDLPGYAAALAVDRTNIRVDMTAEAARHLAAQLLTAIGDPDTARMVLAVRPRTAPSRPVRGPVRVAWDGKDFAVIQTATAAVPRLPGQLVAEVDGSWNLKVLGVPLSPGDEIEVDADGQVTFHLNQEHSCSQCRMPIKDVHRDHKMQCTRRGLPGDRASR